MSMSDIARAVELLQAGELVGVPTETVYGLGADAANPAAVAKIFAAKGRPADHPLIVHIPDAVALDRWAREVPDAARKLAAAFWPGPLTLILKRQPTVPDAVTGGQDTVGLRVPNHPVALELLREFAKTGSGGIAAPSANRFGRISPTTAAHVREELGDKVAWVLDGGACAVGIESTIVDLSRGVPVILRPGAITTQDIERVLALDSLSSQFAVVPESDRTEQGEPRVSGSLEAHYAPLTPMAMASAEALPQALQQALSFGQRVAVLAFAPPSVRHESVLRWVEAAGDAARYAHDLYATLRDLDAVGADLILLEAIPEGAAWAAVADRLRRALRGAGPAA